MIAPERPKASADVKPIVVEDFRPPASWNITAVGLSVKIAMRGVSSNRLRSLLTMLGVIIGVGAVIVAIGIGQGSQQAVSASIQRLGTNVLTVMPGQQRTGAVSLGFGTRSTLVLADSDAILQSCPSIGAVSPQVNRTAQVVYLNKNENVTINGVGTSYSQISNHPVEEGRFFTAQEAKSRKRVCLLGSTTATNLFGTDSPVGKSVRIVEQSFLVVGRLASKGGQGVRNPDDAVYVPTQTAMYRLFGMLFVQNITTQATDPALMSEAQDEITKLLHRRHRLAANEPDDFMIFNQADLANARNEQQATFSSLITYLAIVSLGVGGIGIMNIMLVSVTERTREIGVRKAIGARRRDILAQFIFEALMLSASGGLLGVLAGLIGSKLVGASNNWTVAIQPSTVILAFSFSVIVGVFFGFYPALKASKLHPIEALHYE